VMANDPIPVCKARDLRLTSKISLALIKTRQKKKVKNNQKTIINLSLYRFLPQNKKLNQLKIY